MKTTSAIPPVEQHPSVTAGIVARFAQVAIGFGMIAALLFLGAGRLDWIWAWVLLGIYLINTLINAPIMLRRSPETVAERSHLETMQGWDRLVGGLWGVAQYLALPLMAGLDARFGWTPAMSIGWHWVGAAIFVGGLALSSWAMISNAFFASAVRIQQDRGHTVCRSGPYHFVRHPGYVGFILQSLGMPILLGSWWTLLPGIVAIALIVIRTTFEDRLLRNDLPGYQDYAHDVCYRLIPGVW